jgi:hypothetical protein
MIGGSWGELTERQKLVQLLEKMDVGALEPIEARELLGREVDFTRVTTADQRRHLGQVFHDNGDKTYDRLHEEHAARHGISGTDASNPRRPTPGEIAHDRRRPDVLGTKMKATRYFGYRTEDVVKVLSEGQAGRTVPMPMPNDLRDRSRTGPQWG